METLCATSFSDYESTFFHVYKNKIRQLHALIVKLNFTLRIHLFFVYPLLLLNLLLV